LIICHLIFLLLFSTFSERWIPCGWLLNWPPKLTPFLKTAHHTYSHFLRTQALIKLESQVLSRRHSQFELQPKVLVLQCIIISLCILYKKLPSNRRLSHIQVLRKTQSADFEVDFFHISLIFRSFRHTEQFWFLFRMLVLSVAIYNARPVCVCV